MGSSGRANGEFTTENTEYTEKSLLGLSVISVFSVVGTVFRDWPRGHPASRILRSDGHAQDR